MRRDREGERVGARQQRHGEHVEKISCLWDSTKTETEMAEVERGRQSSESEKETRVRASASEREIMKMAGGG